MHCTDCFLPVERDNEGNLWHVEETDESRWLHAFDVGHMPRVERILTDEEIEAQNADAVNQLPLFSVIDEFEIEVPC